MKPHRDVKLLVLLTFFVSCAISAPLFASDIDPQLLERINTHIEKLMETGQFKSVKIEVVNPDGTYQLKAEKSPYFIPPGDGSAIDDSVLMNPDRLWVGKGEALNRAKMMELIVLIRAVGFGTYVDQFKKRLNIHADDDLIRVSNTCHAGAHIGGKANVQIASPKEFFFPEIEPENYQKNYLTLNYNPDLELAFINNKNYSGVYEQGRPFICISTHPQPIFAAASNLLHEIVHVLGMNIPSTFDILNYSGRADLIRGLVMSPFGEYEAYRVSTWFIHSLEAKFDKYFPNHHELKLLVQPDGKVANPEALIDHILHKMDYLSLTEAYLPSLVQQAFRGKDYELASVKNVQKQFFDMLMMTDVEVIFPNNLQRAQVVDLVQRYAVDITRLEKELTKMKRTYPEYL